MNYRYPYFVILAIGIIYGIIKYPKLLKANRTLVFLLIITLAIEVTAYIIASKGMYNDLLYNIFLIVQPLFIGFSFAQETNYRHTLISMAIVVVSIFGFWIILPANTFNSNGLVLILVFAVGLSLNYFYQIMKYDTVLPLHYFSFFWISIGFLVFGVINILSFGLMNLLTDSNIVFQTIFVPLRIYSNYLLYILFLIAFIVPQNSIKNA